MPQRWLIQSEAAAHVRLCPRAFRDAIAEGRFPAGRPASKSGRRKLWSEAELDAALLGDKDAPTTRNDPGDDPSPQPADPIMAAIHAAETEAAARRAQHG